MFLHSTNPRMFGRIRRKLLTLEQVGKGAANIIRDGRGGVVEQFVRQGTLSEGGFTPWKPSQRALRVGGHTLVDTARYFAAWRGRTSGSITRVSRSRTGVNVQVGLDPSVWPRVNVFQSDQPTRFSRGGSSWTVAPRPVSLNRTVLEEASRALLNHITGGVA